MSQPARFYYTITVRKEIPWLTLETIVREIKNQYPKLPRGSSIHSLAEVIIVKHHPDIPELDLIIVAADILKVYQVEEILLDKKPKELT